MISRPYGCCGSEKDLGERLAASGFYVELSEEEKERENKTLNQRCFKSGWNQKETLWASIK